MTATEELLTAIDKIVEEAVDEVMLAGINGALRDAVRRDVITAMACGAGGAGIVSAGITRADTARGFGVRLEADQRYGVAHGVACVVLGLYGKTLQDVAEGRAAKRRAS